MSALQVEAVDTAEDGDVFDGAGNHVGSIDTPSLNTVKEALSMQVYYNGEWYIYKLEDIVPYDGEKNGVQPT